MTIYVNGEQQEYEADFSVQQLLEAVGVNPDRVVVELNRTILSQSDFSATFLKQSDRLELIQFVAGG